jgi:hypothetical protein
MILLQLSVSVEMDEKPAQAMVVVGKPVWATVAALVRLVREWLG